MADGVLIENEGKIATITVNRPENRNAMDIQTRKELFEGFKTVDGNDDIRVVILRGAGDEIFIAGGDLELFSEFDQLEGLEYANKYSQGLYNFVANLSKPTIAAVDGPALGGGTEIAIACDIRISTEEAVFGLPEVKLGVLPVGGGTQRLSRIVGAGTAKELLLTGRTVDAAEAAEIGLVNHVYPADEFEEGLHEMAEQLLDTAPIAQRLAKESMNRGQNLQHGLDFERMAGAFVFGTDDKTEGVNAFLEDREPEYEGQ